MIEPSELEALLRAAFPGASVLTLEDLTGTKDHSSGHDRGARLRRHVAHPAAPSGLSRAWRPDEGSRSRARAEHVCTQRLQGQGAVVSHSRLGGGDKRTELADSDTDATPLAFSVGFCGLMFTADLVTSVALGRIQGFIRGGDQLAGVL